MSSFVYKIPSHQPLLQNPKPIILQRNTSFPTHSDPQSVQHTVVLRQTSSFQLHKCAFVVFQRNWHISLCIMVHIHDILIFPGGNPKLNLFTLMLAIFVGFCHNLIYLCFLCAVFYRVRSVCPWRPAQWSGTG
jgi:hypothetical protein